MSERTANMGLRVELRQKRGLIEAEISSYRESLRGHLSLLAGPGELDGERVLHLAIALREKLDEWRGLTRQIDILSRELGE